VTRQYLNRSVVYTWRMSTQLNKSELTNVLFCPEGCHTMYAAYKLDGYELITASLCLAYQLHALDWRVM